MELLENQNALLFSNSIMVNIDILKKYIIPIDVFYIDLIKHDVERHGTEYVYKSFLNFLDCSRISKDGLRLQQTIGFRYKYDLTHALYFVQSYFEENEKNCKLQEIVALHNKNLEFEKEHPPVIYKNKQKSTIEKKRKIEQSDNITKNNKSAKEIKNEHKINRINALKFNLTFAKNGNKTI